MKVSLDTSFWNFINHFQRFPTANYMFKINNGNTRTICKRTRCEICSKLTIRHAIVDFEQVSSSWIVVLKQRSALEFCFDVLIQHWRYLDETYFWCFSREFCLYLTSTIYIFSGYDGYICIRYIWINLNWLNVDGPNSKYGICGCTFFACFFEEIFFIFNFHIFGCFHLYTFW